MEVSGLLNGLGIKAKDPGVYGAAFRHPSANAEDSTAPDYERLEFLGDSLIGLIVSEILFRLYPDMDQGELSALKAHFVKTKSEAGYARELGLGPYIVFGGSVQGDIPEHVLEDVFESFSGALLIDQGLDVAYSFLSGFLYGKIKEGPKRVDNPKSDLQEAFQAEHREPVTYKIIKEEGPAHRRNFVAAVYFENEELGRGEGHSKKEAETNAAADALEKMAKY